VEESSKCERKKMKGAKYEKLEEALTVWIRELMPKMLQQQMKLLS
jgi:hypothetical protein